MSDRLELPQNQVRRSGGVRPGMPNVNGYPQGTTRTAPRAYPGNVRGIDDPDQPITSTMIDYVWGNTAQEAMRTCQQLARQHGMSVATNAGANQYSALSSEAASAKQLNFSQYLSGGRK